MTEGTGGGSVRNHGGPFGRPQKTRMTEGPGGGSVRNHGGPLGHPTTGTG